MKKINIILKHFPIEIKKLIQEYILGIYFTNQLDNTIEKGYKSSDNVKLKYKVIKYFKGRKVPKCILTYKHGKLYLAEQFNPNGTYKCYVDMIKRLKYFYGPKGQFINMTMINTCHDCHTIIPSCGQKYCISCYGPVFRYRYVWDPI